MKSVPKKSKAVSRKPSRPQMLPSASESKLRAASLTSTVAAAQQVASLPWTFLTNHSHVLVLLSQNPSLALRQVALQVGITERSVQRIIADLEAGGVIQREKIGRQNHYLIQTNQPLRHPIESHRTIGDLLALLSEIPK